MSGFRSKSDWLTCPNCKSKNVESVHIQDDCFPELECLDCGNTGVLGQ